MSKATSPLIGAPLLILITISVALLMSGWLTTFSREETGSISNKTSQELSCQYAQLYIRSVNFDCNNSCASGILHNLTVRVENLGEIPISINQLYVENTTGNLFTFNLNETKSLSVGDRVDITNLSSADCSGINNSIDNLRIVSINCPSTAYDRFPGEDVTYTNC